MIRCACRCAWWIVVPVLFGLVGCKDTASVTPPPPPEVTVAHPIRKQVETYHEFTGHTEAIESVEVRARVKGFVQSVEFTDSSQVKKGDLLFVIEPESFQAALDRAKANEARAAAELQSAKWEFERVDRLAKSDAAPEKELHDAITRVSLAEADLKSAQAEVETAELDVSYTQVRSPIDGRVSRKLVDVGNLVGANENTLLTTVIKMDPIYAYFNVSERIVLQYLRQGPNQRRKPGERQVFIGLANEKGCPHEGEIDFVDNTVDPDTGTIRVRGLFPNDDLALMPGLFARVRIPIQTDEASVLVRERALGSDLAGKYLLVVDEKNDVEQRPVEIGALVDGMRVVLKGITPDERYIVNGLQRARPGLPVTPMLEEMLPVSAPAAEQANSGARGTRPSGD